MFVLLSMCLLFSSHLVIAEEKKKVEVIEVYGYKHLTLFKKEWEQKRFEFMDFFNANIDDTDLKFDCRKKDARGTRIKRTVCKHAYDWRISQEQFNDNLVIRELDFVTTQAFAQLGTSELEDREEDKIEAVQSMLHAFPEFQKIYKELQETRRKYKEAHKKTFGAFSNGADK